MSLLSQLSDPAVWESFYEYKASLAVPTPFLRELRGFIDARAYLPVCERIARGERFPLPKKSVVSKMDTQKKRVVYAYPRAESTVLKLLTYLMLRRYDGLFSPTLYSFRPGRTAKDAIRALTRTPGMRELYSYQADVSNYFNSVPIDRLLPLMKEALGDDPALLALLTALLTEPYVLENGVPIREEKGVMAGTPPSAFFANLYLSALDRAFAERGIPYARYSDDIIVFAESEAAVRSLAQEIRLELSSRGLAVNAEKEHVSAPADGWVFLGFRYQGGVVDIAPASLKKLKAKMRRKTRALQRWQRRSEKTGEQAAKAFIRIFNAKLFEGGGAHTLSWSHWYFPVLNTTRSLKVIDAYAQDCIRCLAAETRTKSRFNVRYEELKRLGYRSLVHAYYEELNESESRGGSQ
ncbi:MAG: group II intron reverse transcriptase domain-containing protein [Clostridia bacterium]|nr:group II intron reverse transcriptase domain-containing protein [Clostridia bacterium]